MKTLEEFTTYIKRYVRFMEQRASVVMMSRVTKELMSIIAIIGEDLVQALIDQYADVYSQENPEVKRILNKGFETTVRTAYTIYEMKS